MFASSAEQVLASTSKICVILVKGFMASACNLFKFVLLVKGNFGMCLQPLLMNMPLTLE